MKKLNKITLSIFLMSALFINVLNSKVAFNDFCSLSNPKVINTAFAEDGGGLSNGNCPIFWGSGCHPDNWGATCIGDRCPVD